MTPELQAYLSRNDTEFKYKETPEEYVFFLVRKLAQSCTVSSQAVLNHSMSMSLGMRKTYLLMYAPGFLSLAAMRPSWSGVRGYASSTSESLDESDQDVLKTASRSFSVSIPKGSTVQL